MKRWLYRLVATAVLLGCSENTSTTDPLRSGVQVSFATSGVQVSFSTRLITTPVAPARSVTSILGDTLRDGTNTLIIDRAQLVVRKLELERSGTGDCTAGSECEEVVAGPALVDLPLTPGAQQQFTVNAPAGSYRQIAFEVHKVSDSDPAEAAFRQAHPELLRNSVLVQGRFNGTPFAFLSDVSAQQELALSPALVVSAGGADVNVTIHVDISGWFRGSSGGLLDPSTANKGGANEHRVSDNIRSSMRAFEDQDHDGDDRDG